MKHSLPQARRMTTRSKALVTGGLVALTVAGVGGAAFASFTATSTASQTDSTGTMSFADIAADSAGNRLSVGASDIAPGDTISRAVTLTNTGSVEMVDAELSTIATTSSLLDTDTTNGLQLDIRRCSEPWTESAAPYTYTCTGTTSTVLASTPVIGSNLALDDVSVAAGESNHLVATLTFPTTADNTFQDLSSTIEFTFTGIQRAGTAQ